MLLSAFKFIFLQANNKKSVNRLLSKHCILIGTGVIYDAGAFNPSPLSVGLWVIKVALKIQYSVSKIQNQFFSPSAIK
jgi:hypothetical protein